MTHHLILGAGPAGVIAAETIRKHAPGDTITIVGDEKEPPYSRMAIPYLLMGNVDERGTYLRKSPSHFKDIKVNLVHASVKRVDIAAKKIALDNDESITFDTLLIATGSHPVRPPIPGIDAAGVHSCWTLDDARAIMALATPGARVLQLGAGFIGCIIMEALSARGVHLSVVEMGDRMVPRMMGPAAGGMIKNWCQSKGVDVFTAAKVEGITQADGAAGAASTGLIDKIANIIGMGSPASAASNGPGPLLAKLSTGQTIEADVIISATGVKPTIGFLRDSGIQTNIGVLADDRMQTSVPGVYVAGDCAEAFDNFTGTAVVSAIQPNAADQARIAALNMVGQNASLRQVTQINVLDTLGLVSTSFGSWQGVAGGEQIELKDDTGYKLLSMQFKDDVMVGCNSIGWTDHIGALRGLVEGKVKLGEWKTKLQADPTQLMAAYLATAQAQGQWSGSADVGRRGH